MESAAQIARRTTTGRLAGVLFVVGALAALPANLLFRDPSLGLLNHLLVASGFVSGFVCLAAPWRRIPDRAFHAVAILASAEVAFAVWAAGRHGPAFEWFFVLIAVFIPYVFATRRAVAAHIVFCSAMALLPLAYQPDSLQQLGRLGVLLPMLWVATTVVVHLREGMDRRQRELADMARRDPLTGIGNRRQLAERLGYELARHARTGRELALLVLDLDDFKEVNDTLGHPAGDRVLCDVAAALAATVRAADTVIRHGGDEFCVIAPETGEEDALALAQRIRAALLGVPGTPTPVSASMGTAIFPRHGTTADVLFSTADSAERTAKATHHRQLTLA